MSIRILVLANFIIEQQNFAIATRVYCALAGMRAYYLSPITIGVVLELRKKYSWVKMITLGRGVSGWSYSLNPGQPFLRLLDVAGGCGHSACRIFMQTLGASLTAGVFVYYKFSPIMLILRKFIFQ